jgi:hypothetical protein
MQSLQNLWEKGTGSCLFRNRFLLVRFEDELVKASSIMTALDRARLEAS